MNQIPNIEETRNTKEEVTNVPSLPHEPVVTDKNTGSGVGGNTDEWKTFNEIIADFKKRFQLPDGTFIDHSYPPHEEGEMDKWFEALIETLHQQLQKARQEREKAVDDALITWLEWVVCILDERPKSEVRKLIQQKLKELKAELDQPKK